MTTRSRLRPNDGDPRHGSPNGYHNLQCRCVPCKDAWAAQIAKTRSKRVPPPPNDPRHGRATTYQNYRCRCRLCQQANNEEKRHYRKTVTA